MSEIGIVVVHCCASLLYAVSSLQAMTTTGKAPSVQVIQGVNESGLLRLMYTLMFDSHCDIDSLGAVCIDAVRPGGRKTGCDRHESGRVKQQYVDEERSKRIFYRKVT